MVAAIWGRVSMAAARRIAASFTPCSKSSEAWTTLEMGMAPIRRAVATSLILPLIHPVIGETVGAHQH